MIRNVTITGADDSIDPIELIKLWRKYPFVEFGILHDYNGKGRARFPSEQWLQWLNSIVFTMPIPLAIHLCGRAATNFITGKTLIEDWWHKECFQRVQINGHMINPTSHTMELGINHYEHKVFIFQHDHVNAAFVDRMWIYTRNVALLFDDSGGRGVTPSSWPDLQAMPCGYAGGLSPDNLAVQVPLIEAKAGKNHVWVDMETGVRTDDKFDLEKVTAVLEFFKSHIDEQE